MRDGWVKFYVARTERIRNELLLDVFYLFLMPMSFAVGHITELYYRAYKHVIEVLHLQAVSRRFEMRMTDTGVVGKEELSAVSSQCYRTQQQFSTLAQTAANDRHDTYAECGGIEDLVMEQRQRSGVLMTGCI